MKVRRYKLRKLRKLRTLRALRAPRNPVAVALRARRGGAHKKTSKALRRSATAALTHGLNRSGSDE